MVLTGFALMFCVVNPAETVIEGINKIGSLFYGPILAAFLVGLLWKKPSTPDAICGLISGIAANICLWVVAGDAVHWMWWNVVGLSAAILATWISSLLTPDPDPDKVKEYTLSKTGFHKETRRWWRTYLTLCVYFFVILAVIVSCTLYGLSLNR